MNLRRVAGIVVLSAVLASGSAQAAYQPERDIHLNLTVAPSLLQFSGATGRATFELQEALHRTITRSSGLSVNHSYVWVSVNGAPLAGVDPFWVEGRGGTR